MTVLVGAALVASACGSPPAKPAAKIEPAKIERVEGSGVSRLTLTEKAVQRLGIQTTTVRETVLAPRTIPGLSSAASGAQIAGVQAAGADRTPAARRTIPYSAVLYDTKGDTWAYTNPQPLVYLRQRVKVDYVEGDVAVLSDGPALGTAVVIVGAPELFGAETGVGH